MPWLTSDSLRLPRAQLLAFVVVANAVVRRTIATMDDPKNDLAMAMTMAAFTGISWYIGVEINASLFLLFKRRRGLYFWACALASWGVITQPVFIILADFGVWKDPVPSIVMIYLSWFVMVVPQSWVLYSRLHLLMSDSNVLKAIKCVLIFNSIVFSIPTITIGTIAVRTPPRQRNGTNVNSKLPPSTRTCRPST